MIDLTPKAYQLHWRVLTEGAGESCITFHQRRFDTLGGVQQFIGKTNVAATNLIAIYDFDRKASLQPGWGVYYRVEEQGRPLGWAYTSPEQDSADDKRKAIARWRRMVRSKRSGNGLQVVLPIQTIQYLPVP